MKTVQDPSIGATSDPPLHHPHLDLEQSSYEALAMYGTSMNSLVLAGWPRRPLSPLSPQATLTEEDLITFVQQPRLRPPKAGAPGTSITKVYQCLGCSYRRTSYHICPRTPRKHVLTSRDSRNADPAPGFLRSRSMERLEVEQAEKRGKSQDGLNDGGGNVAAARFWERPLVALCQRCNTHN
jgi:hypothetical protein